MDKIHIIPIVINYIEDYFNEISIETMRRLSYKADVLIVLDDESKQKEFIY